MQRMDTEVFCLPDRKAAGEISFTLGLQLVIREGLMQALVPIVFGSAPVFQDNSNPHLNLSLIHI